MRYVVTGAAGFIGSHLAEALVGAGHDVVGLDCFTDYYDPALKEENARGLDVRARRPRRGRPRLRGLDGVFHLAGQPGARSFGDVFPSYLRRNVLATQRVFEAAVAAGVKVVWASSSSVYGDAEQYPTPEDAMPRPNNPYGDHEARLRAARTTHTRASSACAPSRCATSRCTALGSVPTWRSRASSRRSPPARSSSCTATARSRGAFTYVADVVDATAVALERAPGIYNVGGGEEATMREAIALLEEVAGRPLRVATDRRSQATCGGRRPTRAGSSGELGWRAATPLRDGLAEHWQWASARVGAR